MGERKTELVSFRTTPTFRAALKFVAEREKRSQANFLEKLLLDYCEREGLKPPQLSELRPKVNMAAKPSAPTAGRARKSSR